MDPQKAESVSFPVYVYELKDQLGKIDYYLNSFGLESLSEQEADDIGILIVSDELQQKLSWTEKGFYAETKIEHIFQSRISQPVNEKQLREQIDNHFSDIIDEVSGWIDSIIDSWNQQGGMNEHFRLYRPWVQGRRVYLERLGDYRILHFHLGEEPKPRTPLDLWRYDLHLGF